MTMIDDMTHCFAGVIMAGCQDASGSWDFEAIKEQLGNASLHRGTLNIRLDDYQLFIFSCDKDFPHHRKKCGLMEGLKFQRCRLRMESKEIGEFIVKTLRDYWGERETLEVIAPFLYGASSGVKIQIQTTPVS